MAKLELFSLIVCNILANICYSIIVPFLPLEFKRFELDERIYGYIFGVFAAAVMIGSLVVGKLLSTYGRKLILISGLALMGASMLCFGFIEDVENHYLLTVMCLVIRSIQGVSSSMIQTTSYAITAITYPDDQQKYLGFLEASMGVGLLIGPVAGSILYSSLGFKITFLVIGSAFVILTPLLRFVIPRSVDDIDIRDVVGYESSMSLIRSFSIDHGPKTMKYSELFKRKIFCFTSIAAFFAYFQSCYMEPVLALRLTEFGVDNIFLGVFFAFQPITYVICSLNISWFTDRYDGKLLIFIGLLLTGISQFFVGPSPVMPDSLVIMCIGQFLIGGFSVFFVITCLPEMIKDAVEGNPDKQLEVTDISSGVFNCMLGSGQMLGPIYGSFISNAFNFRLLADSVAWSLICFSLAYFAVCNGYQALKNQKQIPLSLSCQAGEQELSSSISLEECLRNRKDSQVF